MSSVFIRGSMAPVTTLSPAKIASWSALAASCLMLAAVVMSGCSSKDSPSAVVSGKVTLAGAPLAAGTVLFMTDTGDAAAADLGPDGAYTLHCKPDRFKIAVTPPPPVDPLTVPAGAPKSPANPPAIPRRYHDFGTSGLALDVKPGNNPFNIDLKR